jgi:hypothetical protein
MRRDSSVSEVTHDGLRRPGFASQQGLFFYKSPV